MFGRLIEALKLDGKHSGTLMALIVPVALWAIESAVLAFGGSWQVDQWVYVASTAAAVGAINHFTDIGDSKSDG